MNRREAITFLLKHPVEFARMVGFDKLTDMHNEWMIQMISGEGDMTLQAHRGSYKTTCLTVSIPIIMLLYPNDRILFERKTDNDVKEVTSQIVKIIGTQAFECFAEAIYGRPVEIVTQKANEITLDTVGDIRGTSQIVAMGTGGSLTGKHFDRIFTDDIVNVNDRVYRAERERTKLVYQELQNLKNRGGRIFNTGTPWHVDDAFSLMPKAKMFDCYSTGLLTEEQIEALRRHMSPSLFAANYELRHIAAENALFTEPPTFTEDESLLREGVAHVDAAYGGEDYTAFTCARRIGEKLYMYGRMWHSHVDTVIDTIVAESSRLMCSPIMCETNGDKGYLAKELGRNGAKTRTYTEKENKHLKISTYLRKWWPNIVWLKGTDVEFLAQIMDYTEDAEHDDAPDSAACMARYFDARSGVAYQSPFGV